MGGSRSSFDYSSTAVYDYKNKSETLVRNTNGHQKLFTFFEYLNDQLELQGHVFAYTFTHPHGNPEILAKELGGKDVENFLHTRNPNYFRMSSTDPPSELRQYIDGPSKNKPYNALFSSYTKPLNKFALTMLAIDPITKEVREYYAAYYKDINEETKKIQTYFGLTTDQETFNGHLVPTGIESIPNNNWIKQAKRDFKKLYATNPKLKERIALRIIQLDNTQSLPQLIASITTQNFDNIPDTAIPSNIVFIAHSLGNLDVRQYLTDEKYDSNTVKKVISIDGVHLGSDALQIKYLQGGFWQGVGADAVRAIFRASEDYRKTNVPVLNTGAFIYHIGWRLNIFGWDSGIPNPLSDEDVLTASLLMYLAYWPTGGQEASAWQMASLNLLGTWQTDAIASHIEDPSWQAMNVLSGSSLSSRMKDQNFWNPQNQALKFRFINPRGIPTHEAKKGNEMHGSAVLPYFHMLFATGEPEFQKLPTLQSKLMAMMMMMIEPDSYLIQDGSFSVPKKSSDAEGVSIVENQNIKLYPSSLVGNADIKRRDIERYDMPYIDEHLDYLFSDILAVKRLADLMYLITFPPFHVGFRVVYLLPIVYGGGRFIDANIYKESTQIENINAFSNAAALSAYLANSTSMMMSHATVVRDSINFDRNTLYPKLEPPIVKALSDAPSVRADQFYEKHNQKFLKSLVPGIITTLKEINLSIGIGNQVLNSGTMSNGATISLGAFEVNPDIFLKGNFNFKNLNLGVPVNPTADDFKEFFKNSLNDSLPQIIGLNQIDIYPKSLNTNSEFKKEIGANEIDLYVANLPFSTSTTTFVIDVTGKLSNGVQSGPYPQTYYSNVGTQNFYMNFQGYLNESDELEVYGTIPTMNYELDSSSDSNSDGTVAIAMPGIREAIRPKSITLKTDKTIISGTLDDFDPKRMKYFQFSLNFGPWQDILVRDDYGHYQIGPILLAEGQNIITFRGENSAGHKNWQMLRIIRSSTPLLPSALQPEHQKVVNSRDVRVAVEYHDTQFEPQDAAGQIIYLDSFRIGNTVVPTAQVQQSVSWNTYTYNLSLGNTVNLTEGDYDVEIRAHDIYNHTSFARWSFSVDTTPPSISFNLNSVYQGGSTLNLSFNVTDNRSTFIYGAKYWILNNQNQIIATLNTSSQFSIGNQSINWDGMQHIGPPTKSVDGTYKLQVSVADKAGNLTTASCDFVLDSTPPQVITAKFDHPIYSKRYSQGLNFNIQMSEVGKAVVAFTQENSQLNYSYLTEVNGIVGNTFTGQYTWKFDQDGNTIPDGTYLVKIIPLDLIYQQGKIVTLSVTIDRTGPVVADSHVTPLVLANNGSSPYQADLQFTITDDSPLNSNHKVFGNLKLTYEQTGQIIQTWNKYPFVIGNNSLHFNLSDPNLPKGMFAMKMEIVDVHGNTTNAIADVIRDGIPPIVDFPANNATLSDTTTLIGIAQDPDWTNSQDFETYQVFAAQGNQALPTNLNQLGTEWKTVGISVPLANQNDYSKPYQSARPISESNPISYFDPTGYSNGPVTLLIVVSEKGLGRTSATLRQFQIDKTQANAAMKPAIDLILVTRNLNFTNNQSLNFTVLNSQNPANIEIDIFDSLQNPIYHRSYNNVPGLDYFGKPQINWGNELGSFLWQDEKGLHLALNGDATPHHFKGNLFGGGLNVVSENFKSGEITANSVLSFDVRLKPGESRMLDFSVNDFNQQLYLSYILDDNIPNATNIKLGKNKISPAYVPAQISLKPGSDSVLNLNWDGKLPSGGFGPDGSYSIKISASGINGLGFTQASNTFNVKSNFGFKLANITPSDKSVDPFGIVDRISIEFNLNKDSYVTAKVFDSNTHLEVITLKNHQKYLGQKANQALVWNGAYPNIYSQARKVSGNFYITLQAIPIDNPQSSKNITVSNIVLNSHSNGLAVAQMQSIGSTVNYNGDFVNAALGNNQYSWSLFATGDYYPPKGFNYQLEGSGLQTVKIHPFVPFAGLAHRYFDTVKFKAEITVGYNWHATKYKSCNIVFNCEDGTGYYTNTTLVGAQDNGSYSYNDGSGFNDHRNSPTSNRSPAIIARINKNNQSLDYYFQNSSMGFTSGIDSIANHQIAIYSETGKYLDTIYPLNMNPPCGLGQCVATSEKGMFRAEFNITTTKIGLTAYFQYNVKIKPEQDISYSRLTNRFYPWYGYVHKSPQDDVKYTYDFSAEFKNEKTLGFLGINHMNGWVKSDLQNAGFSDSFDSNLFPQTLTQRNEMISSFQNMYHNFDYQWVTEDITYREYLEGEHFEFIPITNPIAGGFVTLNRTIPNFNTHYMVYTSQAQDMNLKWPITYEETERLNNQQLNNINQKLKQKDIEVFDLTNPVYQIDLDSVSYKEPNKSNRFMQGAIYKDTGYESNSLSQVFSLPANVIQSSVIVSVTANSAKDIDVIFKQNGLKTIPYSSDSKVSAKWSGSFTPVAWSTDLDPVLPHGVLDSKLITFNETGFESYSPDLVFAQEYPFAQQSDLTYTAPYLFYKNDRNNPNSGQILNPNVRYNPWEVKVYDITGSQNVMFDVSYLKQDPTNIFNNKFKTKLRLDAVEKRYIQISGKASGPYELLYFDGNRWKTIEKSNQAKNGRLAFWNISRLNGKVTVALRVSENNQLTTRTQDIYIGQLVKNGDASPQNLTVYSPYKRARVYFHPQSFAKDTFVSVTPVQLSELNLESRPEIYSIGPIAEILPHGPTFNIDTRPTLVFLYSNSDIQELSQQGVDVNKLNVYYINENGGLELAANTHSWVTGNNTNDPNGSIYGLYHQITAKLDHFSPYALLEGEIYPKPSVHASQKNARIQTITIYGQAEKNKKLFIYLDDDGVLGDQDFKSISYEDQNASISSWIFSIRKFGQDYLDSLSASEKATITKARNASVTQNSAQHQKEQSLENLWQQEYDQMQQTYLNQLNNAISYTLDQPIYKESSFTTRNITYTYQDQNGKTVTATTTVLIDPNQFGVGKFTTRNIQLIGIPSDRAASNNFHDFRSIKAIDYSALNKKIKVAKESWNIRGIRSIEYNTQTASNGTYQTQVTLPLGVTQNHVFVTYEKTSLAKNRAIAHMIVGYDKDLPTIVSVNVTPQKLNANTNPWNSVIQVQSSEYGKIGINKIDPQGKLVETIFQECEPNTWVNFEWKFDSANKDGIYRYSIFTIDESGNSSLPFNGEIILDRYPPVILANKILKAFNPSNKKFNIDLISNETINRYDLKIYDDHTQLVSSEIVSGNPALSRWNPNPSENRQYRYQVTAYDAGFNTTIVTGDVYLDTKAPENPDWLQITHLGEQFFVQSNSVIDDHLLGYGLKLNGSQIDFKDISNFLTSNKKGDQFYYYSIIATDWAGNTSPHPVEKAIYSDNRAIFIELSSTQSALLQQDGFIINIPIATSTSLNFYIAQHLKSDNYRPVLNYSGFVAMPDYYRAAYAYPKNPTGVFDFTIPYDATQATSRQLNPNQFRLFRHDGLHWIPVTNVNLNASNQTFKGSLNELGYFVLALPKTELLNDNSGPDISFVRLANNNLIPSNLIITANISDRDTAIDPSSFKLTLDGNTYSISDLNFKFTDTYGRSGTLIANIPQITGSLIPPGSHIISLESKDLAGNLSRKTITVKNVAGFTIENPLNYPNPVRGGPTKFSFELSQAAAEVIIRIYTTTGKLIQEINAGPALVGYNEVPWNVIDKFGQYLANDVYIYVVIARDTSGEVQKAKGKLMILQ